MKEIKIKQPRKTHSLDIKSIWWYPDNNKLISCAEDGKILEWVVNNNVNNK